MNIGDVKTFVRENPFWVVVGLVVVVSLILLPVLVLPMNKKIDEEARKLGRVKDGLAKYAKMSLQTIPDEKILKEEKKYLGELQAELEKMRQEVGKKRFNWITVLPESGQKYPDPIKYKLEYGKRKQKIIEQAQQSLVQFDPRTLAALFWNFKGDPSPGQMFAAEKELPIIEGILKVVTDPEMKVNSVHAFTINPAESKEVALKVKGRIEREAPKEEEAPEEAQPYKTIPIKLVLDMDFRSLNLLTYNILCLPHKIDLNIRLIERLGKVGEKTVRPMVRVDMDMEAVDFAPAI